MFLFIIWCASVAADQKTYLAVANTVAEATATIQPWFRQDFDVKYATLDEAIELGAKYFDEDVIIFEDKFFVYNKETNRFEYDCDVNRAVNSDLSCRGHLDHCEICPEYSYCPRWA